MQRACGGGQTARPGVTSSGKHLRQTMMLVAKARIVWRCCRAAIGMTCTSTVVNTCACVCVRAVVTSAGTYPSPLL